MSFFLSRPIVKIFLSSFGLTNINFLSLDGSEARGRDSSRIKSSFLCFLISVKSSSWNNCPCWSLKAEGNVCVQISHLKFCQMKELTPLFFPTVLFFSLNHLFRQLKWMRLESPLHAQGFINGFFASSPADKQTLHLSSWDWLSLIGISWALLSSLMFVLFLLWTEPFKFISLTINSVFPNLMMSPIWSLRYLVSV